MRPLCQICYQRPCQIETIVGFNGAPKHQKKTQVQYRKVCDLCIGPNKKPTSCVPTRDYTKKSHCDYCGFRAKFPSQLTVVYCDGDSNNNMISNRRTICLNCVEEVKRVDDPWGIKTFK